MSEHLHHRLKTLHQQLLDGKLPRSVRWDDVVELMRHLGRVEARGADEVAFALGTQREVFKRPHTPELGVDDVSRLRRFLKQAGAESPQGESARSVRMVVVIDHHAAHVFSEVGDGRPKESAPITPYDPHHFHHHLVHRKEAHYEGDRVPEDTSFYEETAAALVSAGEIVLVGSGKGKSSAVSVLVEYLGKHHADLARRVKATEILDLSALTEPQIEAIAKRHMITK
jgi:hypothetical protein